MMGNELLVRFRRRSKTMAGRPFRENIGFRLSAILSRMTFEGHGGTHRAGTDFLFGQR